MVDQGSGTEGSLCTSERAEAYCREGSELCKQRKYRAAAAKYSEGIKLAPKDHRLWSNRAVCYAALKEWSQCSQDALRSTYLKPDCVSGWLLFAKALWKDGMPAMAKSVLAEALEIIPGNPELLVLNSEIDRRSSVSRSSSRTGSSASMNSFRPCPRPPKLPQGRFPSSRTNSPSGASSASTGLVSPSSDYSRASSPTDCSNVSTPRSRVSRVSAINQVGLPSLNGIENVAPLTDRGRSSSPVGKFSDARPFQLKAYARAQSMSVGSLPSPRKRSASLRLLQ